MSKNIKIDTLFAVRDARQLSKNEKVFLYNVVTRGICKTGRKRMIRDTGLSNGTITNVVRSLLEKGLITSFPGRYEDGRSAPTHYVVNDDEMIAWAERTADALSDDETEDEVTTGGGYLPPTVGMPTPVVGMVTPTVGMVPPVVGMPTARGHKGNSEGNSEGNSQGDREGNSEEEPAAHDLEPTEAQPLSLEDTGPDSISTDTGPSLISTDEVPVSEVMPKESGSEVTTGVTPPEDEVPLEADWPGEAKRHGVSSSYGSYVGLGVKPRKAFTLALKHYDKKYLS